MKYVLTTTEKELQFKALAKELGYKVSKIKNPLAQPRDDGECPIDYPKPEIVYHQFGWSMTLYKFYQVIRKTPKMWVLRELKKTSRAGDYHGSAYVKPVPGEFVGGEFRKTAGSYSVWKGDELNEDYND
jgi:hypothetical protein